MANDASPSGRAGKRCVTPTRVDLLTILLTAALCSASYCLGIWHNSRGAADSRILGPSAAVSCSGDTDEPLDFEAHHAAEGAGLSVSSSSATAMGTGTRRALLGAAAGRMGFHGVAWAARADGGGGGGGGFGFTDAGAVRA